MQVTGCSAPLTSSQQRGREGDFMLTVIDEQVLEELITESVMYMRDHYETW